MEHIYIDCTKENKKILKDLKFYCSGKVKRIHTGFIVVSFGEERECFWSSSLLFNYKYVKPEELLEFIEKHRGELTMSKLNLL